MAWTSCANFADHRRPDGSPCTQLLFRCVTRSAAALTRGQHLTRTSSSDQTLWLGHTELNPDRVIRFEDMGSSVKQMTQHFFRYRTIGIPCSSRTALSRKALEDGNLTRQEYQMVQHHRRRSLPDGHDRSRPTRNPRRGRGLRGSEYFTTTRRTMGCELDPLLQGFQPLGHDTVRSAQKHDPNDDARQPESRNPCRSLWIIPTALTGWC